MELIYGGHPVFEGENSIINASEFFYVYKLVDLFLITYILSVIIFHIEFLGKM